MRLVKCHCSHSTSFHICFIPSELGVSQTAAPFSRLMFQRVSHNKYDRSICFLVFSAQFGQLILQISDGNNGTNPGVFEKGGLGSKIYDALTPSEFFSSKKINSFPHMATSKINLICVSDSVFVFQTTSRSAPLMRASPLLAAFAKPTTIVRWAS